MKNKQIIYSVIISFALAILLATAAGMWFSSKVYYICRPDGKNEVTSQFFHEYLENDNINCKIESEFNTPVALLAGSASLLTITIIFLIIPSRRIES